MTPRHSLRDDKRATNITNRIDKDLTHRHIHSALQPFGVDLKADQILAIRRYIIMLNLWNQRVSLTSLNDPWEILQRHFGESMFAASQFSISSGRLADVGSGAGFPGLALKILCPELQVRLIEPNGKKCVFLLEVARYLRLSGVEVTRGRIENLDPEPGLLDFVTARAVGQFDRLLKWSRGALREGARLVLWLGAEDAARLSQVHGWLWGEAIHIPQSARRVLLIGRLVCP